MANTLTSILPKILAGGLMTLRELAIMPRSVNSSYSTEAAMKGTTVDIPIPTAVSTIAVTPSNTLVAPGDTTPGLVQLSLDQWQQNQPFHLTDKELTEIDRNRHFVPMQMEESIKSLANDVNTHIHEQYRQLATGIFGYTGTAGTTPFGSDVTDATNARKLLNQQLCPRTDRRSAVNFDAEASMLALSEFSDVEKVAETGPKIEGIIGRKFGIEWMADDAVLTHTAGTLSNGSSAVADVDGALAAGVDTLSIDETTLTGTLVVGDIVSFAGHSQTYAVIENTASAEYTGDGDPTTGTYTASGNAITDIKIYPALQAAVADDEVMTLRATHVINTVFHRDAFAYATRPLVAESVSLDLGSRILSMQDPVTGLVLRLEVSRQRKQVVWEFDILWGSMLVRPELAVRIAG